MSTKIQKDFVFLSAIHFENSYMANLYEMTAEMTVETDDVQEQNTAIERMMYFISNYIENSIFVNEKEKTAIENYQNAGMRVCLVPEDPYDQILGLVLINKCNAIMEDRITVNEILFGSKLSNHIKFNISSEAALEEYSGNHWWNDSSLNTQNTKKSKKDKIVNLSDYKKVDDWEKLELTWD